MNIEIGQLVDIGHGPQCVVQIDRDAETVRLMPSSWRGDDETFTTCDQDEITFDLLRARLGM